MLIPKILHTIWIGNKIPSTDYRHTWDIFDGWDLVHWTDDKIKSEFGDNVLLQHLYDNEGPTLISDYARLLILQKYGGIYSDVDMMYLKPFEHLLENIPAFLTYQFPYIPDEDRKLLTPKGLGLKEAIDKRINVYNFYNVDIYLNNNFIGSVPNSDMINTYITVFEDNYNKPIEERFAYVDYGAGPAMTTYVGNLYVTLDGYTQRSDLLTVFESSVFHPTNYIQFKDYNYRRDIANSIEEQVNIGKQLGSYAIHLQMSAEVEDYLG